MGILSKAFTLAKNTFSGKALDLLSVAYTKPIETAKAIFKGGESGVKALVKQEQAKPLSTQIGTTIKQTAIYAGSAVAAAVPAVRTAISTGIKEIIPKTTKGKIVAAAVAPIAASAIVTAGPKKTAGAVKDVFNFQTNAGKVIANPTLENVKTLVQENPVISTVAATAGALALGAGVAKVAGTVLGTIETKKQTEAFNRQADAAEAALKAQQNPILISQSENKPLLAEAVGGSSLIPTQPQLATTKRATSSYVRKRKKARKPTQNINQRVNVLVRNDHIGNTKRYLNTYILNR